MRMRAALLLLAFGALALCTAETSSGLSTYLASLREKAVAGIKSLTSKVSSRTSFNDCYKSLLDKTRDAKKNIGKSLSSGGKTFVRRVSDKGAEIKAKIVAKVKKAREAEKEEAPPAKEGEAREGEESPEEMEKRMEEFRELLMKALLEYQQQSGNFGEDEEKRDEEKETAPPSESPRDTESPAEVPIAEPLHSESALPKEDL